MSNKALVREYLKAFNDRDQDTLSSSLAPDAVEHGIHEIHEGEEAIVQLLDAHFTAFPDYRGRTHAIIEEGDTVAVRYSAEGTHTGEYEDIDPTGLAATWTGMAMYRVEDDQIAEIWIEEDRLGLLEQLEFVKESEPAHLRL